MDAMKGVMVAEKELVMDDILKALTEADVEAPEGPAPLPPLTLGNTIYTHTHTHTNTSLSHLTSTVVSSEEEQETDYESSFGSDVSKVTMYFSIHTNLFLYFATGITHCRYNS